MRYTYTVAPVQTSRRGWDVVETDTDSNVPDDGGNLFGFTTRVIATCNERDDADIICKHYLALENGTN